jgi:hypothetical protein
MDVGQSRPTQGTTDNRRWELPSSSGRELCTWTVVEVGTRDDDRTYQCDVSLEGCFFGETLDPWAGTRDPDFALVVRGMLLRRDELERLARTLGEWLSLSPAELRDRALELSCGMGGLHDQSILLTLGRRDDTSSMGRPVATVSYLVGRMRGELTYIVDQSCLRVLMEGIERALDTD